MKDCDIRLINATKIVIKGNPDNSFSVSDPDAVIDNTGRNADIRSKASEITIGLPTDGVEHIEVSCGDCEISVKDLTFEQFELDCDGNMKIDLGKISGRFEVNLSNASITVSVPSDLSFTTDTAGRDVEIAFGEGITPVEDSETCIELNGRNSRMFIDRA
ncbi:MAG: hypothetical protein J5685_08410 [Clostridiales bacterium]|nr:hypothetical protein [Clostridiales bacterium]